MLWSTMRLANDRLLLAQWFRWWSVIVVFIFYLGMREFFFPVVFAEVDSSLQKSSVKEGYSSGPGSSSDEGAKGSAPFSEFPIAADTFQETLQNKQIPVELTGDQVEFLHSKNTVIAKGHVVIVKGEITLKCDSVEFSRDTQKAVAEGHVVLTSPQGTIKGEKMTYDFEKMTGQFVDAEIISHPYYGRASQAHKLEGNHLRLDRGYLTTCDHDKPHFRILSKKLDVYPHDKMIARGVRLMVGNVPLAYLPRHTQALNDPRFRVTYTPGHKKNWGIFLLTDWRYQFHENLKASLRLDFRERKDIAWGINAKYKVPRYGSGVLRTYYMKERSITAKRFYRPRPSPTPERERLKVEWRHQWKIDEATEAIWQYYKLSDAVILKEYFEREYKKDPEPKTFFTLTRNWNKSTLSFLNQKRVNRFTSIAEKMPEIRWDVPSQKLALTPLYFKSTNTYSNLSIKNISPTEIRKETMRVDSENQVSYPLRMSFIEFKPFVGGRETYYSKTIEPSRYNILRGVFTTGADLTTKFYKVYDVKTTFLGGQINRLRHVIMPSIAYLYQRDPTVPASLLDAFDSVDTLQRDHSIALSLENKLQTKRGNKIEDLLRTTVKTDFRLKDYPGKGGFDGVKTDLELRPTDWLQFYSDTSYNTFTEHLESINFEIYLRDMKNKWSFGLGKRFQRKTDDQVTSQFYYKINPKWKLKFYQRFDVARGGLKEQEYTISRDLHEWEMDINFNQSRGQGSEIWLIFRLKAFPDDAIELGGVGFNERKVGSQSFETVTPLKTPTSP